MGERVQIYADGSCNNNAPIGGGWGAILSARGKTREVSGYVTKSTTSQRMEIAAAIGALECLTRPASVTICTDSTYVLMVGRGGHATHKNRDLVDQMRSLMGKHDVEFVHVRGHSGDPLNERAHTLANEARLRAEEEVRSWEEARLRVSAEYRDRFDMVTTNPTQRLYPWIKKRGEADPPKVRTPRGLGVLINVLGGKARVLLDDETETGKYKTGKPFPITRNFPVEEIVPIPFGLETQEVA